MPSSQRRKYEVVSHTILAITIVAASTYLAAQGKLTPETTVAAWGLAAASIGTPIVVRRAVAELER